MAGGESQVAERVVSQLLTEIDGIEELKGIWILAGTNRLDMIDPALLRPGRFDVLFALPPPYEAARLAILRVHTRGKPLAEDVDLQALASDSAGWIGADLEAWCREATTAAMREFLAANDPTNYVAFRIAWRHFQEAREQPGRFKPPHP